ncbi:MAG: IMP cyclohydrolase [Actinomycetota bacterium]|nr:IMP cyclohydrolase [Actinomycetota bacterium]
MTTLQNVLRSRPYPGRGCVAARTSLGDLVFIYFLTGRSAASKNRELSETTNGDIIVRDRSNSQHDALRHYCAAVRRGGWRVIGNGDQVEPIAASLAAGRDMLATWSEHTFEPDPPIFTSRIWMAHQDAGADCILGFARRSERSDGSVDRVAWVTDYLAPGSAVLMTTYGGSSDHVTSTPGPTAVTVAADSRSGVLDEVWQALHPDVKVAAFAVSPSDRSTGSLIVSS